jgi:hypothetical protein
MEKLAKLIQHQIKAILDRTKKILDNESRIQNAVSTSKKDRLRRKNQELDEERNKMANRGLTTLDDTKRMNFFFVFGCRPSTGVKANTTMVKDIFDSFIDNADRINFMVLLPNVFGFMNANDASFETATSSKIKIIKLYHKHNVATMTIGLVIVNDDRCENAKPCHKILKQGLKLDRVHTYEDLSISQLEEKFTWVAEMTTGGSSGFSRLQE